MIELRLVNHLNPQSAPLSYIDPLLINVRDNISLVDKSLDIPENTVSVSNTSLVTHSSAGLPSKNGEIDRWIYSKNIVLGNRSILSKDVNNAPQLFFKYYLGRPIAFFLWATSSSVSVSITSTQITYNSTTITYTNKSVREIVKEINDANDGVKAFVVSALPRTDINTVSLKTGSYTITTSGSNIEFDNSIRVYSATASTTDLDLAKETIRNEISVLVDGQKSNLIKWDIEVESYDSNGFLVSLYLDKKFIENKTIQVKYKGISSTSTTYEDLVEIVNPEKYLHENYHFELKEHSDSYFVRNLNLPNSYLIGLFSRSGSVSVEVTSTEIKISGTSIEYKNKSVEEVVAEINNSLGTSIHAVFLNSNAGTLVEDSITTGTFTVKTSGFALTLANTISVLFNNSTSISPLLPFDEEPHKPWYPRIRKGSFSKFLETNDVFGYGSSWGHNYGGTIANRVPYIYNIPEYDNQLFHKTLGSPYKYYPIDDLVIINDLLLQTTRFPLESGVTTKLYLGNTDITSKIKDIDLNNGLLYLKEALEDYTDIQATYVYEDNSYIYTSIDLNPIDNPDLINKYIGLYIIPERVGNIYWGTSTTVYHIIMDSSEDIESALSNLTFSNGVKVHPLLLGIYKISPSSSPEDVDVIDMEVRGGGIKREGVEIKESSKFIFDYGRWDGEPFQSKPSILLEIPKSLLKTNSSTTPYTYDHINNTKVFMDSTGLFTLEDIKERASKWIAEGTGLVIDTEQ